MYSTQIYTHCIHQRTHSPRRFTHGCTIEHWRSTVASLEKSKENLLMKAKEAPSRVSIWAVLSSFLIL